MTKKFTTRRARGMQKGFTLIEMIVSLMIFSVVAVVALAALVKIIDANKKAQTTQDAVVGLSFALEAMSRELRTATNIRCESGSTGTLTNPSPGNPITFATQACPSSGANFIAFKSTNVDATNPAKPCNLVYAYLFTTNSDGTFTLQKAEQPLGHCDYSFNTASYTSIVPNSVVLTGYKLASSASGTTFPIFFVQLSGYAGTREEVKTSFNVQTAASERTI